MVWEEVDLLHQVFQAQIRSLLPISSFLAQLQLSESSFQDLLMVVLVTEGS